MPFFDRHWWLSGFLGALVVVLVVAAVFWQGAINFLPSGSLDADGALLWQVLVPAFVGAIIFFLLLRVFSHEMRLARRRAQIRSRAIEGAPEEIPLSTIAVDISQAPDVRNEPLVLAWHLAGGRRWLMQGTLVFLLLFSVGELFLVPWLFFTLESLVPQDPTSLVASGSMLVIALCGLLLALSLCVLLAIDHPLLRPSTVTFSADGVQERTRWGRRRTVRWEQARLLEVRFAQAPFKEYVLYGAQGTFVRWVDWLPSTALGRIQHSGFTPLHASQEEMARSLRGALALVAHSTSLFPRTFERRLQVEAPSAELSTPGERRRITSVPQIILVLLLVLFFAGVPLAAGAYVLIEGPIEDPTLNLISGELIALGGGLLVGWLGVGALVARLRQPQTPPDLDLEPLTDEQANPGQTYELVLPQAWPEAVLSFFIPLLIGGGGVVGVVGLALAPGTLNPQWHLTVVLLSMCGLLGVAAFAARLPTGLRSITRIQATPQGLRSIERRKRLFIPWEHMESVRVKTIKGRPTTYAASADQGRMTLEWSATTMPARQHDGSTAISAAALAYLVGQRAGVSLVKEELTETSM
jgi:hypothetical protein